MGREGRKSRKAPHEIWGASEKGVRLVSYLPLERNSLVGGFCTTGFRSSKRNGSMTHMACDRPQTSTPCSRVNSGPPKYVSSS